MDWVVDRIGTSDNIVCTCSHAALTTCLVHHGGENAAGHAHVRFSVWLLIMTSSPERHRHRGYSASESLKVRTATHCIGGSVRFFFIFIALSVIFFSRPLLAKSHFRSQLYPSTMEWLQAMLRDITVGSRDPPGQVVFAVSFRCVDPTTAILRS